MYLATGETDGVRGVLVNGLGPDVTVNTETCHSNSIVIAAPGCKGEAPTFVDGYIVVTLTPTTNRPQSQRRGWGRGSRRGRRHGERIVNQKISGNKIGGNITQVGGDMITGGRNNTTPDTDEIIVTVGVPYGSNITAKAAKAAR